MAYPYVLILFAEGITLSWMYATDPPTSSSPLSVALGWGAMLSMVALLIYSVARRSRALRQTMRLSLWLQLHIFLALQAAMFTLFHCYHFFARIPHINILNPGVLNLAAVVVVFFSGVFGRYLYSWLPRSLGGVQLGDREVEEELGKLGGDFPPQLQALMVAEQPSSGVIGVVKADVRRRAVLRQLRRMQIPKEQRALVVRKANLERQRAVLKTSQRVFRNWIVLHRPVAAVLYVLSLLHVVLSYMFTPSLGN